MNETTTRNIIDEIYCAFVLLGAESGLLGVIGSWRNSLSDERVLAGLRCWNDATRAELKGRIEHYETSSRHLACSLDAAQRTVDLTQ